MEHDIRIEPTISPLPGAPGPRLGYVAVDAKSVSLLVAGNGRGTRGTSTNPSIRWVPERGLPRRFAGNFGTVGWRSKAASTLFGDKETASRSLPVEETREAASSR